jgi:HTH-type transcriptional regulator / antitoxin HigA
MDNDARLIYEPTTVPHPGETVVEYLECNGWSQRDLARRAGLTPKTISEICNGKAPITATTALALEKIFQRPAHFWLNLQRIYDEAEARSRAAAKSKLWKEWAERFPLAEMRRFKWLDLEKFKQSKVEALLYFFGVSSPEGWESVWLANAVAYRQTRKFRTTFEAISAWVRATEVEAAIFEKQFEVKEYDEASLRSSLTELRHQTRKRATEAIDGVQKLCAASGVIFVFVPELPHTGISGCARWLTEKKALIALTLRYKTDDQIWFTFFHEVGHLLLHKKKMGFVIDNAAEDLTDKLVDPTMQKNEEEANRFAADALIPPQALSSFIQKDDFTQDAIHDFADELMIGPGIVVGRLQREGALEYHQGNKLKQILEWNI